MKELTLELYEKGEGAALYTILFKGEEMSEFDKFLDKFRNVAELNRDYQIIVKAVVNILSRGALERYFRPEGKMADNVQALPLETGKLRLYCIRLSDSVLILGNGGVKTTATYNEDEELNGYVIDLQKFDKLIQAELRNGTISIVDKQIIGTDGKEFKV